MKFNKNHTLTINKNDPISKGIILASAFNTSPVFVEDYSDYKSKGTPINGPFIEQTIWGKTIRFDATNESISYGDRDIFSFGDGSNDRKFSMFFLMRSNAGSATRILASKDSSSNREWLAYWDSTNSFRFALLNSAGAFIGRTTASSGIANGNWYKVLFTYDGSQANSGFKIYINGVRADTADNSSGTYTAAYNSAQNLRLGARDGNTIGGDMNFANFVIWKDRVLTANDAMALNTNPYKMYKTGGSLGWMGFVAAVVSGGNTIAKFHTFRSLVWKRRR